MLTRTQRNRFLRLASFLEALPNRKFNIYDWVRQKNRTGDCGSVCCAIGWLPVVFPRQWKYRQECGSLIPQHHNPVSRGPCEDAVQFFGVRWTGGLQLLFTAVGHDDSKPITPKMVARYIRRAVEADHMPEAL